MVIPCEKLKDFRKGTRSSRKKKTGGIATSLGPRPLRAREIEDRTIVIYIYMGVDQNIVAGVLLEMTLRPPLRFLALFKVFIVFHYRD